MSSKERYRVVHHNVWRDNGATFDEWWTLETFKPASRFRRARWVAVTYWQYDSGGGSKSPVRYWNEKDAKNAAKHYGVKIQEATS